MKRRLYFITVITAIISFCLISQAYSFEISGNITAEGRYFFSEPQFSEQERHSVSLAVEPEYYHEWENGSSFTFTPFARFDSADSRRNHYDIREFSYLYPADNWEIKVGISKVFWGVTEFIHLVDIINQTDLVEYIDGEDKLGQPIAHLSFTQDWGILDLFLLPFFRERTFPGSKGRFRSQLPVEVESAEYESSAEEHHIDLAIRYSHTIGDWDFGIYHFKGTGREPLLIISPGPSLIPLYEQIDQTGLDIQAVKGDWLLKLESLYRSGQGDAFFAAASGFEYSFYNIAASGIDLGLIGEWAYDERGEDASTVFDNDLLAGLRVAFNDAAGSELIAGIFHDLDSRGDVLSLESSRRFGDNWRVTFDAFFLLDSAEEDPMHAFRNDDNIQVELSYYF